MINRCLLLFHPSFSISPVMSLQTIQDTDRYKRSVGFMKIGNRNINEEQVVGGIICGLLQSLVTAEPGRAGVGAPPGAWNPAIIQGR